MTNEPPPLALARVIRRNRRRYGGYIAHAGLAVLLIGVAASSSFQHSHDVSLRPGQTASVDGYTVRYVRPISDATPAKLSFGAVLDVSKHGKHVTTLRTTRGFYPAQDPSQGPVGRYFGGSSDSNVGLDWGPTHDIWAVVNPNLTPLQPYINKGNALFTSLMRSFARQPVTQAVRNQAQASFDAIVGALTVRYQTHPWPVEFLLIVSPLVTWIWVGALIIISGGLIALWPIPVAVRRRSRAPYAAPRAAAPAAVES